ncbi:MAG TPA: hypothetical protein VFY56_02965 [Propionibacteriaceae bacterium]|nr:hypothetical protein [Propionibacteriaceae bacterium]
MILIRLIHQTKIRIWYTLGTQDVRKRPQSAGSLGAVIDLPPYSITVVTLEE